MSGGARYLVGWGAAVAGIAVLGLLAFGLDGLPFGLLAGAGAGSAMTGVLADRAERVRPRAALAARPEAVARTSASTATAVSGAVVALVGVGVTGQALTWLGIVVLAAGAAGVLSERRGDRRRVREGDRETPGPEGSA